MTLQIRYLGSRLLLILALVAALLAGTVAVQWVMGQRNVAHAIVTRSEPRYMAPLGNGDGGGRHRQTNVGPTVSSVGGDVGGGH